MKYKFFITLAFILTTGFNVQAFDLGILSEVANTAKIVADKKKANDEAAVKNKELQALIEKMPTWNKMFFYTLQKNPQIKAEQVVLQYWMAQPESNYEKMKDNEFEFEKEKEQYNKDLVENVKSFKLQEFVIEISAQLGKYNIKNKTMPVQGAVGEDNMLLTTSRVGQFETQKPTMTVTPSSVYQEETWLTVPTGYIFQVVNPEVFSAIKVEEDLARKIAAVQGSRSALATLTFEVTDVDLKNKKWNQSGTVGIIKIKVKEVKTKWTHGPDGDVYIGSSI